MIDPDSLVLSGSLTVTGIIAVVVLLLSAIAAMAALRLAVRAMFAPRRSGAGGNAVLGKARELGGFAGMAFAVLLSAVLTTGVASAASWILDALGWGGSTTVVLRVVGILVAFVVDAAIFLLVVTVLAGEHAPWRDLRWGAVIAGVGIGVVRILGTEVVAGSVEQEPAVHVGRRDRHPAGLGQPHRAHRPARGGVDGEPAVRRAGATEEPAPAT